MREVWVVSVVFGFVGGREKKRDTRSVKEGKKSLLPLPLHV
jgi:hypothetical protein